MVNHAVILRDKYLFGIYMQAHEIPTPRIIAMSNGGHFYIGSKEVSWEKWAGSLMGCEENLFVKEAGSCCARGVKKIRSGKWDLTEDYFRNGKYIVQKEISNCDDINKMQPNSVNTLRLVTVMSKKAGVVELLSPGGLRVGGGADVDNWAAGGLFVGLDAEGKLQKYGYYKPGKHVPCKVENQPQTEYVFEGRPVPFYSEAVDLVKKAHSLVPELAGIGWDVALTSHGPSIIEGNDDWEVSMMQVISGGCKKRFNELGFYAFKEK